MPGFLRRLFNGGNANADRSSSGRDNTPGRDRPRDAESNSDRAASLTDQSEVSESASLLDHAATPFADGASRGDFVWALARELGAANTRDQAINHAANAGWMSAGRAEDGITRAEAATVLARALALDTSRPEGQVAYFADVGESDWFFENAHAARRHGLIKGGGDNLFRGNDALSADEARIVVARASSAAVISPVDQSPGRAPMLKPSSLENLLTKEELTGDEIAKVRDDIAKRSPEDQAKLYEKLNGKVDYRNQRDNEGKYAKTDAKADGSSYGGDVMCNVTSLAMALTQLGIQVDESSKQFEDLLDEMIKEQKLGSRYEFGGQAAVAKKMGAKAEREWTPAFGSGSQAEQWYTKNVLPRLQSGSAATMSIAWGAGRNYYHIVRLQWVEAGGLRVDDPYGKIYNKNGYYTYEKNDVESSEGEGARGEDRLWSWDTVASLNKSRYVQFLDKA